MAYCYDAVFAQVDLNSLLVTCCYRADSRELSTDIRLDCMRPSVDCGAKGSHCILRVSAFEATMGDDLWHKSAMFVPSSTSEGS